MGDDDILWNNAKKSAAILASIDDGEVIVDVHALRQSSLDELEEFTHLNQILQERCVSQRLQ